MTTLEKVSQIILNFKKNKLSPEALQPEADLKATLRFDSLDLMELLVEAEDAFSIQSPLEDANKLKTLGDVVAYINQKISA